MTKIRILERHHTTSQAQGRAFALYGLNVPQARLRLLSRKHITSMTQGRAYFERGMPPVPISDLFRSNVVNGTDNLVYLTDNIIHIQG